MRAVQLWFARMSDGLRVFAVLAISALAFLGAVLVWLLLVATLGDGLVGAALVGLAAILSFTPAIAPSIACVVRSRSRQEILWLTPIAGLGGAFGAVLAFHYLLQILTVVFPSALPDAAPRAQAAGSVLVWAVLFASTLLVAVVPHVSRLLRILSWLASAGLAVGMGMWVRALGI